MTTYCPHSNQEKYPFSLPELPFNREDFAPHFSAETFDYHYDKHHKAYLDNLNKLLENNSEYAGLSLEEIIMKSSTHDKAIFNNAAQLWNHTFFWHSIKPQGGGKPTGELLAKIEEDFGSMDKFAKEFKEAATKQFGSGWAWLVYIPAEGKLQIMSTANAETPITDGIHPLLTCDVWEHAYYIDYRNKRPDYLDIFLNHMINWEFAAMHLENVHKP